MPHSPLCTPEPPITTTLFYLLSLNLMTLSTLQKGNHALFPFCDWLISQSVVSFAHGGDCVLPKAKSYSTGCVNVFGLFVPLLMVSIVSTFSVL